MSSQGNLGSFGAKHMPDCTGPTCSSYSLAQLSANTANQIRVKESQQQKTQLEKVCFVLVWHKVHWIFFFFSLCAHVCVSRSGPSYKTETHATGGRSYSGSGVIEKTQSESQTHRSLCFTLDSATWKISFLKGTLCPDGQVRHVQVHAHLLTDPGGLFNWNRGICMNIHPDDLWQNWPSWTLTFFFFISVTVLPFKLWKKRLEVLTADLEKMLFPKPENTTVCLYYATAAPVWTLI